MLWKSLFVIYCVVVSTHGSVLTFAKHKSTNNETSCEGKCRQGLIPGAPCQCNPTCQAFGDCCEDYAEFCIGSCLNKCGLPYDPAQPCQCEIGCYEHKNCCLDFSELCHITNDVLEDLAEELLSIDENNVAHLVSVSPGIRPLIRLNDAIYTKPTIEKLLPLHDNYIPDVRIPEVVTPEELAEEVEFLDLVFASPAMRRAQEFLTSYNFTGSRERLTEIWFGLFNRGGGYLSSTGFEHVFLGELMNGGISGFHNWIYFAREERNGNAMNGEVAKLLDFGRGWVIENSMSWLNASKPIGGGFIGTSPEFEMAIYSVCWMVRPNSLCPISLNGHKLNLQTYVTMPSHSNVTTYVSTSYTVLY